MPYFLTLLSLVFLIACSDAKEEKHIQAKEKPTKIKEMVVYISSVNDIETLFNDLNYTSNSWKKGSRKVPRLYFTSVSKKWKDVSSSLPVKTKKNIFFRVMAPLILMSNEAITKERQQLLKGKLNSPSTIALAQRYKVLNKEVSELSKAQYQELLKRVDIIPVSLALAQAAEESGWGTSRFSSEGNAFFGLWDFSGKGMAPAQQRKELGNYGLARYETPLDSVKGYMYNINIGHAYEKFRNKRFELRKNKQKITGWELAKTLDKYSERGQAYIDGLHAMMKYNRLQATDDAYLSNDQIIHFKRKP
jgi:uncharacterized FlgJ-related protein